MTAAFAVCVAIPTARTAADIARPNLFGLVSAPIRTLLFRLEIYVSDDTNPVGPGQQLQSIFSHL
ncbi:hypothetical protein Pth03_59110 [Planotetraspora thailandica]|uniref:Uncharacterized protein n=1 Tax=Planotetraspora thailandica TaxID=487172 RepID=A0A8J3V8P8_9ACTN|nr:hypothetical protein Pth03_59110 [Planotetraspora thailandica]